MLACIYSVSHGVCRSSGVLVSERTEKAIDSGAFVCADSRGLPERAAAVASVGRQDAVHCARHSAVLPLGKSTVGATFGVSAFTGTEHRELLLISADWVLVLRGCGNVHQYFMKYAWMR